MSISNAPTSFYMRWQQAVAQHGPFCLGLDPSPQVLTHWGFNDTLVGLHAFCDRIVQLTRGCVSMVKPQVAYFERFGHEGIRQLLELTGSLQADGTLVLADVKRGDIGPTLLAYTQAWLEAPMQVDAITLTGYLGIDAMRTSFDIAHQLGKAIFVVVVSSNPEGAILQGARINNDTRVADHLAQRIAASNKAYDSGVGPIGAVVGATAQRADEANRVINHLNNALLLVPGIGAQGGTISMLKNTFRTHLQRIIPTASRALLLGDTDKDKFRSHLARYQQDCQSLIEI